MKNKTIIILILLIMTAFACFFCHVLYFSGAVPTEIRSFTVDEKGTLAACVTGHVVFCEAPGKEESKRLIGLVDSEYGIEYKYGFVTIYGDRSSWVRYNCRTWEVVASGEGTPEKTINDPVPYNDSVFLYHSSWGRGRICELKSDGTEVLWYQVPAGGYAFSIVLIGLRVIFSLLITLFLIHMIRNYDIKVELGKKISYIPKNNSLGGERARHP